MRASVGLVAVVLVAAGCAPSGDEFPDLVIVNACGESIDWRSASNANWFGTLAPDETYVVHPGTDESIETMIFTLPSGEEVELSGSERITLADCGQ